VLKELIPKYSSRWGEMIHAITALLEVLETMRAIFGAIPVDSGEIIY
jgi:hypothetical protein